MTRDEALAEVTRALVELFELDPAALRPEARLGDDLELDSIDAVDLAARLQTLAGRRVEDAALRRARTVGDVAALLSEMTQPRA